MLWLLLASLLVAAAAQATNVHQCTAKPGALPLRIVIEGCVDPPCRLPQGQDAVIHIAFPAPRDLPSMRTRATAYLNLGLLAIPIPYDLGEDAVTCNSVTNTNCPVSAGEIIDYTLRMHIEVFFPVGTSATIEFQIVDDNDSALVCVRVPLQIAAPLLVAAENLV